jgi:6-phosphogluconolactonase/glucosamine-6-phosphate isomerase/deaminase
MARLVEIAAEIIHETEKAYLLFDGARKAWVPKSVTQDNEDGTFTMPERLAQEKEFI